MNNMKKLHLLSLILCISSEAFSLQAPLASRSAPSSSWIRSIPAALATMGAGITLSSLLLHMRAQIHQNTDHMLLSTSLKNKYMREKVIGDILKRNVYISGCTVGMAVGYLVATLGATSYGISKLTSLKIL